MKDRMKKLMRVLGIALALAIVTEAAGHALPAAAAASDSAGQTAGTSAGKNAEKGADAAASSGSAERSRAIRKENPQVRKEETVYAMTAADGSVDHIVVSDHLENPEGLPTIEDRSALADIENVKGDETFSQNDDRLTWNAEGNDIYYQGTSDASLPVSVKVTYRLDGREIAPEELAGKSGRVTIRFDYTNNLSAQVAIGTACEKMNVPFAAMTGVILDNQTFRNIEVTNGRAVDDGMRTIVVGAALPGMRENLERAKAAVSAEELADRLDDAELPEIPDYIEISADAENFSLETTLTVVTGDLFGKADPGKLRDQLGGAEDVLDQLTDAMDQLTEGSQALADGLKTLDEKSGELADGVQALADGAGQVADGALQINSGAGQLLAGAETLKSGLETLDQNSASLNGGAEQVFESLLAMAETQLQGAGLSVPHLTISNYSQALSGVIASLDPDAVYSQAEQAVTAAVEQNRPRIESAVTSAVEEAVRQQVTAAVEQNVRTQVTAAAEIPVREGVTAAVRGQVEAAVTEQVRETVRAQVIQQAAGMDAASYDAAAEQGLVDQQTQDAVRAAVEAQMASDAVAQMIAEKTEEQMASGEVQQTIDTNTQAQMCSGEITSQIDAAVEEQMKTDAVRQTIDVNTQEQMKTDAVRQQIADNTEAQVKKAISDQMQSTEVQAKLAAASEGAKTVISLKTSLDSYDAFYLGVRAYTEGVAQASAGAGTLKDGIGALKSGTQALSDGSASLRGGLLTIQENMPALTEGIEKLRDGSEELAEGIAKLDEEGIRKLETFYDTDVKGLLDRMEALSVLAKSYDNYSGLADGMSGSVRFIYRSAAIGENS